MWIYRGRIDDFVFGGRGGDERSCLREKGGI